MDVQKLITHGSASSVKHEGLTSVIEDRKSLLARLQLLESAMPEYRRVQDSIARFAGELDTVSWHKTIAEMSHGVSALIETQNVWQAELRKRSEMLHEFETISDRIRASLNTVSLNNNFFRQSAFIQSYTENLIKLPDLSRIAAAIQSEALRVRDAFWPTFNAFSAMRDALSSKSFSSELRIATREHFLTTDLLHELAVTEIPEGGAEEHAVVIKETDEQLMMTLSEALSMVNPQLFHLWRGAWDSLVSENPDRIRHTITSVRELVTHVLHALSPDDKVRMWSTAAEHYHNGRPTRKARLLFIYNQINDPLMNDLFQKEIEASLSLIDLFHDGTHEIVPKFSDVQLQTILRRVHSTICALVEIHRAKEKTDQGCARK